MRRLPKCPRDIDVIFMLRLLKALGANVAHAITYNWVEFGWDYEDYRKQLERYFEQAKTGDPAFGAYLMVHFFRSSLAWAKRVIEQATCGDPAWAAYVLSRYCGASRKWAERVIESAQIGNPAPAAFAMSRHGGSSLKWAERVADAAKKLPKTKRRRNDERD